MNTAAAFLAAERNGRLSVKEYEHISGELAALLQGIKTPRVRAVLHPKPVEYPNYAVSQNQYQQEAVTTGQNRQNSQKLVPDNMIPIRLYHITTADKIAGLVDEYVNIGNMEIVFLQSGDYIVDPIHPNWDGYLQIPARNINSVALAAMELEQVVKSHTLDFFEDEDRAADITVSFFAKDKSVMTTTEVLIAFDFTIM